MLIYESFKKFVIVYKENVQLRDGMQDARLNLLLQILKNQKESVRGY